ncbi:hypothetical protein [Microbacterium yannicii]|uniref:hypothetical protein n=1 Tax=Microbacterium yannicii TaxID=671622 RepID=UPI0002D3939D|nr:hypothetical protein [Microbacterium yannicii]
MTTRHQLVINGHTYPLVDDAQVVDAKRTILTAIHDGGAFVEVPAGSITTAEVLITSATSIVIEHIDVPDSAPEEGAPSSDSDGTEFWL